MHLKKKRTVLWLSEVIAKMTMLQLYRELLKSPLKVSNTTLHVYSTVWLSDIQVIDIEEGEVRNNNISIAG